MTCPECGKLLRFMEAGCLFHVCWTARAAIKEFDGKQERKEAEAQAYKEELTRHLSRRWQHDE